MFKVLLSLFLIANSIFGLAFYEGTAFGDYLDDLSTEWALIFFALNFIISHVINIILHSPLSSVSIMAMFLVVLLLVLAVGLLLPYWFIFLFFEANDNNTLPWVIYTLAATLIVSIFVRPILQSMLGHLIELNNNFWDGLKTNAINSAINSAKKNTKT